MGLYRLSSGEGDTLPQMDLSATEATVDQMGSMWGDQNVAVLLAIMIGHFLTMSGEYEGTWRSLGRQRQLQNAIIELLKKGGESATDFNVRFTELVAPARVFYRTGE